VRVDLTASETLEALVLDLVYVAAILGLVALVAIVGWGVAKL
jgi:hypothetical protein